MEGIGQILVNPSWVADHEIWEEAKAEAPGAPWGVITNLYKAKGGRIFKSQDWHGSREREKQQQAFTNKMKAAGVMGKVKTKKRYMRKISLVDGKLVGMPVKAQRVIFDGSKLQIRNSKKRRRKPVVAGADNDYIVKVGKNWKVCHVDGREQVLLTRTFAYKPDALKLLADLTLHGNVLVERLGRNYFREEALVGARFNEKRPLRADLMWVELHERFPKGWFKKSDGVILTTMELAMPDGRPVFDIKGYASGVAEPEFEKLLRSFGWFWDMVDGETVSLEPISSTVGAVVMRKGTKRTRGAVQMRDGNITAVRPIAAKTAQYLQDIHRTIGGVAAGEPIVTKEPKAGAFTLRDIAQAVRDWLRGRNWPAKIETEKLWSNRPDRWTRQARAGTQYGQSKFNVVVRLSPNEEPRFQADLQALYTENPQWDRANMNKPAFVEAMPPNEERFEYITPFFRKLLANLRLAGSQNDMMATLPESIVFVIDSQVVWIDTSPEALTAWLRNAGVVPDQAVKIVQDVSIKLHGPNFDITLTPNNVSARVEAGDMGLRYLYINIKER